MYKGFMVIISVMIALFILLMLTSQCNYSTQPRTMRFGWEEMYERRYDR